MVEYRLDDKVVGRRYFRDDGVLGTEYALKDGLTHGTLYYFDDYPDGVLKVHFAWPHRNGLPNGTAKQWSRDGKLIGTFTMRRGTGWDLWRQDFGDGSIVLSEARHYRDGKWHGFEWDFDFEDQSCPTSENHFWENLQHGIQRDWNSNGRLSRGYPKYWINNKQVTKRQYLRAATKDPNLPPFREIDNLPKRQFPTEVQAAIEQAAKS